MRTGARPSRYCMRGCDYWGCGKENEDEINRKNSHTD